MEPLEFADACSSNGLSPEMEEGTQTLYVRRAQRVGPRVAVVFGHNGLVDWTATCQRVLAVCFARSCQVCYLAATSAVGGHA